MKLKKKNSTHQPKNVKPIQKKKSNKLEKSKKEEELEKDLNFVTHMLSFSNDNNEIVSNLREHFKIEAPEI